MTDAERPFPASLAGRALCDFMGQLPRERATYKRMISHRACGKQYRRGRGRFLRIRQPNLDLAFETFFFCFIALDLRME